MYRANSLCLTEQLRKVIFNSISFEYLLKVALHIPGAYNLSMHLPVVIGTVPFRRISPYLMQTARMYQDANTDYYGTHFLPAPPPYRETATPPPPFEGQSIVSLGINAEDLM